MYCVALDPGGTTGICIVPDAKDPWYIETEELGPGPHHSKLLHKLALWKPDLVICEAFENVTNEAAELISCEYIGVVKAYCQWRGVDLRIQPAGVVKPFWTDAKLVSVGLRSQSKHTRDATRHYLYYRSFTIDDRSLLNRLKPSTSQGRRPS